MIKISPAILQDSSVFVYKTVGTRFKGNYLDFFSNNRDLFEIKTPELVQDFIEKLSISPVNLLQGSDYSSLISIKKEIIVRYVNQSDPSWRKRITWGIKLEVFKHLEKNHTNLYRCLEDCGLISNDHMVIVWWYENLAYSDDSKKAVIGVKGERLSYIYENKILGIDQKNLDHVSLKKSNVGYDIMSVLSKDNNELKPIEVKTSTRSEDVLIYVTENEWKRSSISNYIFHLWILDENKGVAHLYFIKPKEIEKHIPVNQGVGAWVQTKIGVKNYCKEVVTTIDLSVLV